MLTFVFIPVGCKKFDAILFAGRLINLPPTDVGHMDPIPLPQSLPFDVGMVRSIGYELKDGQLTADGAEKLKSAIKARLEEAIHGSAQADSPIYQLISGFPAPVVPEPVEQLLKDRLSERCGFHDQIEAIPASAPREQKRHALNEIQQGLGEIAAVRRGGMNSSDYWDVATVVELACLGGDWPTAGRGLPRLLVMAQKHGCYERLATTSSCSEKPSRRRGKASPR